METHYLQGVPWKDEGEWAHVTPGEMPTGHKRNVFLKEDKQPLE